MVRAGLVVIAIAVALEGAAAARGGGIIVPPAEVDVGATAAITGGEAVGPGTDVLVGMHWASLYWRPTSYELGVGYVGSFRPLAPGYRGLAERVTSPAGQPERFTLNGGYLTLGRTLYAADHLRAWIELRGELLRGRTPGRVFSALGGAARVAVELYASGAKAAHDRDALVVGAGTLAIGLYVEASHRDIASELGATGVTAGMSVRIPFFLAVVN